MKLVAAIAFLTTCSACGVGTVTVEAGFGPGGDSEPAADHDALPGDGGSLAGDGGSPPGDGGGPAGDADGGDSFLAGDDDGPLADLIDEARITTWRPGIETDGQLGLPLGDDRLPVRTTVCQNLEPGDDVQAAIDACDEGEVVLLGPGTFSLDETLVLDKGVVLRGSGSQGDPTGTTLQKVGGHSVIAIGETRDGICYGGAGQALTQDGQKEAYEVHVDGAASFGPGDLALIDVVDDDEIQEGDCGYYKRFPGRSVSQRVEVTAVNAGGSLDLSSPLHWRFRAGGAYASQIVRVTQPVTRWAGVEHLKLQGGTNPDYSGAMAGGIDISNAAYCWVKDVQTDETIEGMHVAMTGTYRCVVRDSNLHHSANYGYGQDCYGIVLRCGAAENLIENNVVRHMNKPIMFNVSGGGNVIAYNYADNSWSFPAEWQEVNIDCHCAFPHMELLEGNFAPHMGATTTHGNAGYLTFFRNYASSAFATPVVVGSDVVQTGNVAALQLEGGVVGVNALGNVFGAAGVSAAYDAGNADVAAVYQLGRGGAGASDVAATSLFRHGNFDHFSNEVRWSEDNDVRELPASLYLTEAPAWWPAELRWPWVGPELDPMVGTLPAKQRSP